MYAPVMETTIRLLKYQRSSINGEKNAKLQMRISFYLLPFIGSYRIDLIFCGLGKTKNGLCCHINRSGC